FRPALNKVAEWFQKLVQPGQDGAILYVRWITKNSYSDTAQALPPIELSTIPWAPAPLTPIPTAQPFDRNGRATVVAAATQTQSTYIAQQATVTSGLATANQQVSAQLVKVRRLPYYELGPSDIWGCPQRAGEIFHDAPPGTDKYLVIASDMEIVGL